MVSSEWRRRALSRRWRGWTGSAHDTTRSAGSQELGREEPETYERTAGEEKRSSRCCTNELEPNERPEAARAML